MSQMDNKLKNLIIGGLVIVAVLLILNWATSNVEETSTGSTEEQALEIAVAVSGNATYVIDDDLVSLTDGKNEQTIPNSSTKIVTQLTPFVTTGDLTGDSLPDIGNILVQSPGGSGTFYYAAAIINKGQNVAQGTNAILIGDRIQPTFVSVEAGVYQVTYMDRPEGAAMVEEPTIEKTKFYIIIDSQLQEAEIEA